MACLLSKAALESHEGFMRHIEKPVCRTVELWHVLDAPTRHEHQQL
jgi:hypothetical protein